MGKNEAQSEGVDSYKMQKITPFSTEDRRTVGMKGEVHTKWVDHVWSGGYKWSLNASRVEL